MQLTVAVLSLASISLNALPAQAAAIPAKDLVSNAGQATNSVNLSGSGTEGNAYSVDNDELSKRHTYSVDNDELAKRHTYSVDNDELAKRHTY
ncbi:hypothetical protein HBH67_250930, partial [Parastagonospora nodorum]